MIMAFWGFVLVCLDDKAGTNGFHSSKLGDDDDCDTCCICVSQSYMAPVGNCSLLAKIRTLLVSMTLVVVDEVFFFFFILLCFDGNKDCFCAMTRNAFWSLGCKCVCISSFHSCMIWKDVVDGTMYMRQVQICTGPSFHNKTSYCRGGGGALAVVVVTVVVVVVVGVGLWIGWSSLSYCRLNTNNWSMVSHALYCHTISMSL